MVINHRYFKLSITTTNGTFNFYLIKPEGLSFKVNEFINEEFPYAQKTEDFKSSYVPLTKNQYLSATA